MVIIVAWIEINRWFRHELLRPSVRGD